MALELPPSPRPCVVASTRPIVAVFALPSGMHLVHLCSTLIMMWYSRFCHTQSLSFETTPRPFILLGVSAHVRSRG